MICAIPFFSGNSSAAHSATKTRVPFLKETIQNHAKFFDQIVVGVCNLKDYELVSDLGQIHCLQMDVNPIFLPAAFMQQIKGLSFDLIYYSEADQKLFCSVFSEMTEILFRDDNAFFVPRRFFKTTYHSILDDGPDRTTLQAHSKDPTTIQKFDDVFYIETDRFRGFGGSWFCSRSFFEKVDFQFSSDMPIEHTSGFNLFLTDGSKGLMSIDPFDFWVEHLSGNEIANKRKMAFI